MACQLQGIEFRIFYSLFHEWPYNSVEELQIEMARGVELSTAEVEAALGSLERKGYVEEFKPGRWQLSPNGHGVRRTLLGELRERASSG
jgi:DNA-binding IclR family transcriptional regulator